MFVEGILSGLGEIRVQERYALALQYFGNSSISEWFHAFERLVVTITQAPANAFMRSLVVDATQELDQIKGKKK